MSILFWKQQSMTWKCFLGNYTCNYLNMLLKVISSQATRNVKEEHVLLRFLKSCRKCTMQLIFHAGFGLVTHLHLYTSHHVQPNTVPQSENKNMNLAKYFSTAALQVRLEKHSAYQITSVILCSFDHTQPYSYQTV